jgi:hypothetical protein
MCVCMYVCSLMMRGKGAVWCHVDSNVCVCVVCYMKSLLACVCMCVCCFLIMQSTAAVWC